MRTVLICFISFWWYLQFWKHLCHAFTYIVWVNWLRANDVIWHRESSSALIQVMAWCLVAPSHFLKQCWITVNWTNRNWFQRKFHQNTIVLFPKKFYWKYCLSYYSHCSPWNSFLGLLVLILINASYKPNVKIINPYKHLTLLQCVLPALGKWVGVNFVDFILSCWRFLCINSLKLTPKVWSKLASTKETQLL